MDNAKGDAQKEKKKNMHRVAMQCQKCAEAVCKIHQVLVCKDCTQGLRDAQVEVIPPLEELQ